MAQIGYTGSDPIADGYIKLFSDGYGGTNLYIDASPSTDQWGSFELHLPGVDPSSLSWADLGGAPSGQVFNGVEGDTLVGTGGNDTFNGSVQGAETMTGGAGADDFVFAQEPWQTDTITDFTPGQDKIDLSAVMQQIGYTGSDPIADGYIKLFSDGNGGTNLYIDASPATNQWGSFEIHLPGVDPSKLSWADLGGPRP